MADNLKSLAAKARLVRAQLRSHGQQVEQINNPRQMEILNTDLEEMHERRENLILERTKISLAFEQQKLQTWDDTEGDSDEDPEEDMEAVFLNLEEADLLADLDELDEQPNEELDGDVDLDDVDELPVGPLLGDGFAAELDDDNEYEPAEIEAEDEDEPAEIEDEDEPAEIDVEDENEPAEIDVEDENEPAEIDVEDENEPAEDEDEPAEIDVEDEPAEQVK